MHRIQDYVVIQPDGTTIPFLIWCAKEKDKKTMAYKFYSELPTAEIKCIVDHFRGTCQEGPLELYRSCMAVLSYGGHCAESLIIPPLIGAPNVANEKAAAADALESLTLVQGDEQKAIPPWVIPLVIEALKWAFDKWFKKD